MASAYSRSIFPRKNFTELGWHINRHSAYSEMGVGHALIAPANTIPLTPISTSTNVRVDIPAPLGVVGCCDVDMKDRLSTPSVLLKPKNGRQRNFAPEIPEISEESEMLRGTC
jgi:hypothetical protein